MRPKYENLTFLRLKHIEALLFIIVLKNSQSQSDQKRISHIHSRFASSLGSSGKRLEQIKNKPTSTLIGFVLELRFAVIAVVLPLLPGEVTIDVLFVLFFPSSHGELKKVIKRKRFHFLPVLIERQWNWEIQRF